MSKTHPSRTPPESPEMTPGATTTLVRADARPHAESYPELHPALKAQLRELQLRTGNAVPDVPMLLRLINEHYGTIERERRGIVESMRRMADEAQALAHEARTQSGEHLQVILDHIKDVVLLVDADGLIRTFNPTGARVFGYAEDEVTGKRIDLLLPKIASNESVPEALERLAASLGDTALDLSARELWAMHKDGRMFPAEIAVSKAPLSRQQMFVLCLRDVSERHASEQAMRESAQRYRLLVDHAPEAIVVLDVDSGRFVDANDKAQQLFGLNREQLLNFGPVSLSPPHQPDGAPSEARARAYIERALGDEVQQFEWAHRDASGREIMCEVRLVRLPSGGRRLVRGSIADISQRKRAERMASAERQVFEQVTRNAPLTEVLSSITLLIETAIAGATASVSLLAADGKSFSALVAPRMAAGLRAVLEHASVGIRAGSCAASVYLGRQVLVADLTKDPFWQEVRAAAVSANLRAAWALPIEAAGGHVLGALGVYRAGEGLPSSADAEVMSRAAQLAGIAIERTLGEEALRSSEAKYRGLFESIAEGVYQSSRDGRLLSVNPAFVAMLGYRSAEEMYGLASAEALYWDPADRAEFARRVDSAGEIRDAEFRMRRKDGQQLVVLENARRLCDASGRHVGYEGSVANITERKRAEQAIFAEKERAQVTLESIGDAVISTDAHARIEYINPVAESLTAWTLAEARGQPVSKVLTLVNEITREPLDSSVDAALRRGGGGGAHADQAVLITRSGHEVAIQESAAPICDRQGQVIGAVVVFHDVTKERRLRRALSWQASHDALTGLINRREFDNRLHGALLSAQRGEGSYALLYIDLDQFKVVNDTCGHQAGDRLLRDVTGLLQTRVRASDTIARLGGDEFGVLLEGVSLEQATRIAEGVRQAIRDFRFVWGASTLSVGASIGIVQIRAETENVAGVMSAADIACYAAKDAGRNRIHVYGAEGVSHRHREMHWVARVTRATEDNRLELYYQPIVALAGGARDFHELTVRLRDDSGELVAPTEFIPAAERYNVMSAIDRWVVEQAIALLRARQRAGQPLPLLAVNLSGTSLNEQSFVDFVLQSVGDPALAAALCFEITETAAVTSLANARFLMSELKQRGCKFSLDDFGTGVSSFVYLKSLPVDFLKIDGQFISHITQDAVSRSMVEAIGKVGRALGIATVAECVESAAVLEALKAIGVDYAQGFHLATPRPLAELP